MSDYKENFPEVLRQAVNPTNALSKNHERFHAERMEKISGERVWNPLTDGPYCLVHWFPKSRQFSFSTEDFEDQRSFYKFVGKEPGILFDASPPIPNSNGIEIRSQRPDESFEKAFPSQFANLTDHVRPFWNAQIFRSGETEKIFAIPFYTANENSERLIAPRWLAEELRKVMIGFTEGMAFFGARGPILVIVSILFAHNCRLFLGSNRKSHSTGNETKLGPIKYEIPDFNEKEGVDEFCCKISNFLWQCFGEERCEYYNENGQWK